MTRCREETSWSSEDTRDSQVHYIYMNESIATKESFWDHHRICWLARRLTVAQRAEREWYSVSQVPGHQKWKSRKILFYSARFFLELEICGYYIILNLSIRLRCKLQVTNCCHCRSRSKRPSQVLGQTPSQSPLHFKIPHNSGYIIFFILACSIYRN